MRPSVAEIRTRTYKARDAWWTVLLVDPVAVHLVRLIAPYRWITPNLITTTAFLFGLGAAACFATLTPAGLAAGALLFHVSFILDCIDGKIARLNGTGSMFGSWLDYVFDRLRVLACSLVLFIAAYALTDNLIFLAAGFAVNFMDMFRYLNALQVYRVNTETREKLAAAREKAGIVVEADPDNPDEAAVNLGDRSMLVLGGGENSKAISAFMRFRTGLRRGRIRPHLVSGIEFQMFVFIVGPLVAAATGTPYALIWVTAAATALVLAFELAIIYMLYRSTKGAARQIKQLTTQAEAHIPAPRSGEPASVLSH